MARVRIGPVRVGGGRKASLTFGAGPFGVTVGGRRKRNGSLSYPNYDNDWEANPATPAQAARYNFQEVSTKMWGGIIFGLEMLLLGTSMVVSSFTPRFYNVLAACSILFSLRLFVLWSRHRKAQKSENPSKSLLKAWEKVEDGHNPSSVPLLGSFIKSRDSERERIRQLEESEGFHTSNRLRTRKTTRVSFRAMIFINFALSILIFLTFRLVLLTVNQDLTQLRRPDSQTSGSTTGKSLGELESYMTTLQTPLVLLNIALLVAFVLVLRTANFVNLFKNMIKQIKTEASSDRGKKLKTDFNAQIKATVPASLRSRVYGNEQQLEKAKIESERADALRARLRESQSRNPKA
jgi:hypothetical protein